MADEAKGVDVDGVAVSPLPAGEEGCAGDESLTIVVVGASGDLAKKKTFPALHDLYVDGLLPRHFVVYGFARSKKTEEGFREHLLPFMKSGDDVTRKAFLSRVFYRSGQYDSEEALGAVAAEATKAEDGFGERRANRLFYFAIPPKVFVPVAKSIHASALTSRGWNRVVVEKPFGTDLASSEKLSKDIATFFSEDMVYRIDHYLGKEMVQNLMILRFANAVFEPMWNRHYIQTVQVSFKEPFGTEGRGGYFDGVGIIRDVMQNHLLQVMSLVAMEPPVSMNAEDIRDEKVKVLRCVSELSVDDVVTGQYGPNVAHTRPGYHDDDTVPADSKTPTFATAVFHVNNPRWYGVPFILKCGKALNERKAEIRIQFRDRGNTLFGGTALAHNELVLRIQPKEAVYLKVLCKKPGLSGDPLETELNLSYQNRFPTRKPPEAYARLILDVLRGDQSQFVRSDELKAAWKIFTPLLHAIDAGAIAPEVYAYGSRGPTKSDELIQKVGYKYDHTYAVLWNRLSAPEKGRSMLDKLESDFAVSTDVLRGILNGFLREMERGLAGDESTIKMIPAYVTSLPTGAETGDAWAIDLGGSNLRVVKIPLLGGGKVGERVERKVRIPNELMRGDAASLFTFIAKLCVEAGIEEGAPLGFTFSFPVNQTSIASGELIEWTKGFEIAEVVGADVVSLLDAAFKREGVAVHAHALVNDTVGTLVARAYEDRTCKIGIILGTGTNAAYVEHAAAIKKWKGPRGGDMVINMEWGGFGSTSYKALPFTEIDHLVDANTPNVSKQRYEKMISGMYLGEILRRCLTQLADAGVIFGVDEVPVPTSAKLYETFSMDTGDVSHFSEDFSDDLDVIKARLLELGAPSEKAHREVARKIATWVATRAGRLAAVGVSGVLTQIGGDIPVSAGIDGSVFKGSKVFQEAMRTTIAELGFSCELAFAADGSGTGAALIACSAVPKAAL